MHLIVFLKYRPIITEKNVPENDVFFQEIYDENLKRFFFNNIKNAIFATTHLIEYQEKKYKTIEQVRHEEQIEKMNRQHEEQIRKMNKQIVWAIIATSIAAIRMLSSLIIEILKITGIIKTVPFP